MVPVWIDIDLDGDEEPLWFASGGMIAVDETLTTHPVTVPEGLDFSAGRHDPVGCVLDVEGDGDRELLVVGQELFVLDVSAPYTLSRRDVPSPSLPPATALDIACGDLNADGLPDAVVAFGIYSSERTENRGFPDYVLMNLGHGRFEIGPLEPARDAFTQGITLADMDLDGRPDIIESIDFSTIAGPSRLLYNRTEPGAQWPVFEAAEGIFDTGTCGMGVAVGDLDADGHLDIYNTSLGLDQVSLGQDGGTFEDATFALGFRHLWGRDGWRDQWSPSMVDMNLDGRLDVLVRHGGVAGQLFPVQGPNIASREADLLYLQREDGSFERVSTPLPAAVIGNGRHSVIGDLDGDGRPDVALGGRNGSATLWTNETTPTGRALTVRLYPTLSGDPAVGARVTALCGTASLTRVWTSGGKMGGSPAAELHFAWPTCTDTVSLTVSWPAGGVTELEVSQGVTRIDALEARWFWPSAQSPGHLTIDPGLAAAQLACLVDPKDTPTCCEVESAPCDLPLPESTDARWRVLIPGQRAVAIDAGYERWSLIVEPRPLRPGQSAKVHLLHVGDPSLLDLEEVFLLALGDSAELSEERAKFRVLTAELDIPVGATEVELKLWPDVFDVPWNLTTGGVFDSRWTMIDSYPYQVTGGVTEFWQWAAYVAGLRGLQYTDAAAQLRVEGLDGELLDASVVVNPQAAGRAKLLVDWALIGDRDTLRLAGGPTGLTYDLPVHQATTLEDAVAAVDSVYGALIMPRLIAGGDVSHVFFVLKDAQGGVLPPEPEAVQLEMEGGEVLTQPMLLAGGYTYLAIVQAGPEIEPGVVRARLSDGREIASWPFERRAPDASDFDPDRSSARLVADEEGGHYDLEVHILNGFDEALGADANLSAEVQGGTFVSGPEVTPEGVLHRGVIDIDPVADRLLVDLYVDGSFFLSLEESLEPTEVAPDDIVASDGSTEPDASPQSDAPAEPAPPASSGDRGGCSSGSDHEPSIPSLGWILLVLLVGRRRRP
jgi:uncharacterized protein (TIGR03382 family)